MNKILLTLIVGLFAVNTYAADAKVVEAVKAAPAKAVEAVKTEATKTAEPAKAADAVKVEPAKTAQVDTTKHTKVPAKKSSLASMLKSAKKDAAVKAAPAAAK